LSKNVVESQDAGFLVQQSLLKILSKKDKLLESMSEDENEELDMKAPQHYLVGQ